MSKDMTSSSASGAPLHEIEPKTEVLHPTDTVLRNASIHNPDFAAQQSDAQEAANVETQMTVWQALKTYKKATLWSILLSTALVMEGYDTLLLANFYALPAFVDHFANQTSSTGVKTISAAWRSGLSDATAVGEIFGLMATGIIQDRFGYKKTIGGALVWVTGCIFILFFAQNLGMLCAGEILAGLGWGVFQTITTAYSAEVCPTQLRAYLTTYVNLCWVFGQLIGSGVLRGMLSEQTSQWGWRIPYAIQWIWPVPLLIGCILAPESPWWLVRHGRYEDAKHALRRLTTHGDPNFDVDKTIAMMESTNEIEREMTAGTSYADCFQGVNLRRTEIVCMVWLVQEICGSAFMGYSTTFYEAAGLPTADAFDLSIVQYVLGIIGTLGSWGLMGFAGRRTIYLYGLCILCLVLMVIGFLGIDQDSTGAQWGIGSMLLLFTFFYDLTVGPICYSLVSELSSTRLKAKSIVLARNVYNISGLAVNVIVNYQLTTTAWNWRAYSGFFWGGACLLSILWVFFRLPEPKGRTYAELDLLFENKVPARKFASTKVEAFESKHARDCAAVASVDIHNAGVEHDEKVLDSAS